MRRDKYGDTDVEDSDDFDGLQPDDGSVRPLNFNDRDRDEELYDEDEDFIEDDEDDDFLDDEDDYYEDEEDFDDLEEEDC